MRTPKQTEASRANGARSKGPVTPQGKLNSSRNSTRHGMFADTIVLEAEEKSQFLQLLEDLFDEHKPRTRTETMLVETIAAARWRQDRIWGMQKIAFDYDVASSASLADLNPLRAVLALRNSPDSVRTHELLLRYDIALDRQISRALLRLHQLQDRKTAGSSKSAEESIASHSVLCEEPIEKPAEIPGTAVEERTQQPAETVTQVVQGSMHASKQPTAKNPLSASGLPSAAPTFAKHAVSRTPAGSKPGPATKKPAA